MSGEAGWGDPGATNGGSARTPSPSRNRARSRSPERRDEPEQRGRAPAPQAQNPGNNLHVSGLSSRAEERDLEEAFSKFGRVQRAQVMKDPHTKDPRGFAFVTMETPEEADAAIQGMNATEFLGKMISVERARRGRARTPTPGAYHGPPKREFDSRGGGGSGRYDDRDRYDRRDDRGGSSRGYDDRRGGYDDRGRDDRYDAAPMRGGDDRGGRGSYDDRRGGGGGYDDRRSSRYDDDRRRY